MPEQQATTVQQTAVPASAAQMPTVPETAPAIAEPALEDEWDEPIEELPPGHAGDCSRRFRWRCSACC